MKRRRYTPGRAVRKVGEGERTLTSGGLPRVFRGRFSVGGSTELACTSRRGGVDEFADGGCWFAAVVAGLVPSGGVGLVGVVFDRGRRASAEQ